MEDFVLNSIGNFNAAVATVLVSIPTTLSLILALNYHTPKNEDISPQIALISLAFGLLTSFALNGGSGLFKAFTASQSMILLLQIRQFGVKSIFSTTILTGVILLLFFFMRVHKLVRFTPTCIIKGLQSGTGIILIVNELTHSLGLEHTPQSTTNVIQIINFIIKEHQKVQITTFMTCFMMSIMIYCLVKWYPRVPWHFFYFLISMCIGYLSSFKKGEEVKLLGSRWTSEGNFHVEFQKLIKRPLHHNFTGIADMVGHPLFVINVLALVTVSLLEMQISLKLCEQQFADKDEEEFEFKTE